MRVKCKLGRNSPQQRREHILAVAAAVFASQGYGATSMSTIAEQLGGSKATLYKYFPSKMELFFAVMQNAMRDFVQPLQDIVGTDSDDVEDLLIKFGTRFLSALTQPASIELNRIVHAESLRFPDMAAMFMQLGPDIVHNALASALVRFAERGQIDCADPLMAARLYLAMVKTDLHMRPALNLSIAPDEAEIASQVKYAVHIFMRGIARH